MESRIRLRVGLPLNLQYQLVGPVLTISAGIGAGVGRLLAVRSPDLYKSNSIYFPNVCTIRTFDIHFEIAESFPLRYSKNFVRISTIIPMRWINNLLLIAGFKCSFQYDLQEYKIILRLTVFNHILLLDYRLQLYIWSNSLFGVNYILIANECLKI